WDNGVDRVRLVGAGTLSERTRHSAPSFNAIRIEGREIAVDVRLLA
ncbi:MAG: metallophosphoesterase, partial [Sphingomonadaceae bacterium]|nr:metallophosphoesterase [Sphingomonadaceae bacterium]